MLILAQACLGPSHQLVYSSANLMEMNELNLLMTEATDQWCLTHVLLPHLIVSAAKGVTDPFLTSFLGGQTLVDRFLYSPGHTSRGEEPCIVSFIPP